MKEQFYTILTAIGKAKIANASAMGTKLNITKLQVGDGGGSYYNPTENQEQLKNKVWEGNIGSITIDKDNNNWIVIETLLPGDIGGFMIREAGILDSDGNLIAVGKYPETYKPITSQGSLKDLKIKMILEITNTSSVTLKVDPTVILATQKDVQSLDKQIKDYGKQIGNIKDLKTTNKDNLVESVNELFTNVDNGKSSLYSAIVGKKVTPRSKDFKDLTEAVTDIKLGQGNAQASEVLRGKTFTNDSGVEQVGTMPNMGSIDITPKTYTQELETGYYNNIKIKGINDLNENEINNFIDVIANKLSKGNSKKANIFNGHKIELESCGLGGLEKTKDVELNLPFEPKFIISEMVEANKAFKPYRFFVVYDSNGSYEIYNENSGYDVSISIRLYKYNRTISWYNHSKNYRKYPKINLYFYDKFPFDLDIDINKYLK